MRCLITAGPTREHLDPVRFLSNGSSGKMGYALAAAAVERGWEVELVSGPVELARPDGVEVTRVVSAQEMFEACAERFEACDVFIAVAAVADYRPVRREAHKGRKVEDRVLLELEPTVDILATLGQRRRPEQLIVGFAAETADLDEKARAKLERKRCDWIVANDVGAPGIGMHADENEVSMWSRSGEVVRIGRMPKRELAKRILEVVAGAGPGSK